MKVTLLRPDQLSIGDLNYIEDRIGPWGNVTRSGHRLQALVWATLHRSDPDVTWEDVEGMEIGGLEMEDIPPADAGPAATANGSRPSARSTAGARRRLSGV